jgi:transposase
MVTRREFTDEFKREAGALWETSGRLQTDGARELGIQPSMLRRWQKRLRGEPARGPPMPSAAAKPLPAASAAAMPSPADLASENAKLKRELNRVRMERDVLKKAIGIFAEVPR